MKIIAHVFRMIVSIGLILVGLLGVFVLSDIILSKNDTNMALVGVVIVVAFIIGGFGLYIKNVSFAKWCKIILSSILMLVGTTMLVIAVEDGFKLYALLTAVYLFAGGALNLFLTFGKKLNPHRIVQVIAGLLIGTIFVIILNVSKNTMLTIVCLLLFIGLLGIFGTPFFIKQKLQLLFNGEHEKLRKRLIPNPLGYDEIIKAHSYLYADEIEAARSCVYNIESLLQKVKEKKRLYFQYICHAIMLECLYFSREYTQVVKEEFACRFEALKSIRESLFKKRHPMSILYQMAFCLNVYADKEVFRKMMEEEILFEKKYNFTRQPNAFFKHKHYEELIMQAGIFLSEGEVGDAKSIYSDLASNAIQPLHRKYAMRMLKSLGKVEGGIQ